ncbi:hypothetical protein AYI69_g9516 [Smittium culicis]|uniref:Uncharacterized protein n=1 Tax=Smittium culicis TaxID=133412 RepID=A0A1R1XC33_9FUNG|nr:hypothetical protein AYI69_g9516 [Smittium culicis]
MQKKKKKINDQPLTILGDVPMGCADAYMPENRPPHSQHFWPIPASPSKLLNAFDPYLAFDAYSAIDPYLALDPYSAFDALIACVHDRRS